MIVGNERRELPARYGNPFRSKGSRLTLCLRCEHYRRQPGSVPCQRLAVVGLVGGCIRVGGLCREVTA